MYAENAQLKPSRYNGCGKELAEGYGGAILTMGGEVWEEDGGDGAEVVIVFGAGEGGEQES